MPLPAVRGSGSLIAIDHARRLRREQQIGAGRPARAVMRARLERDIDRRALARACRFCERDGLGVRAARPARSRRVPTILPAAETMTQPTFGLGALRPARALRRARPPRPSSLRSSLNPELLLELLELPLLLFRAASLPPGPSSGRR